MLTMIASIFAARTATSSLRAKMVSWTTTGGVAVVRSSGGASMAW
jgi:hypothetical protein